MKREKFLEHYMEIQRPLRAYLLAATGDIHACDDLCQIVWQVLWKKLDQFDEARSFKSWSFGIARLETLKWRQHQARNREVLSEATLDKLAQNSMDLGETFSARHGFLLDCIAELTERAHQVINMKYAEGRRSREIGERIHRSTQAVDMMLSRIRKTLRECIERKSMESTQ